MKTSHEINSAIQRGIDELAAIRQMSDPDVCRLYNVDCRHEIIALIEEDLAALARELECALENEETENPYPFGMAI
jgi:hypothetical protein